MDSAPPSLENAIIGQDYCTVCLHLQTTIITKRHLSLASMLPDAGILRLLLISPYANPNEILLEVLASEIKIAPAIPLALLEDTRIFFSDKDDAAMLKACERNNLQIVDLILRDSRFRDRNIHTYLLKALRYNAITVASLLLTNIHFNVRKQMKDVLLAACKTKNMTIIRTIMSHKTFNCSDLECYETAVESALKSDSNEVFIEVLNLTKSPLLTMKLFEQIITPSYGSYYRIYILRLYQENRTKDLRMLLNECIKIDCELKFREICDLYSTSNQIVDIKTVALCIDNKAENCLIYLLHLNIPYCDNIFCGLHHCVKNYKDVLGLILVEKAGSCQHAKASFVLSLRNLCYKTANTLLKDFEHVDVAIGPILETCEDSLIQTLADKLTHIEPEHIRSSLIHRRITVIEILCSRFAIDLSWNNYELLRIAARDITNLSFNALMVRDALKKKELNTLQDVMIANTISESYSSSGEKYTLSD